VAGEGWIGAVDIGGTKIRVGQVDFTGQVFASMDFPTLPEVGLATSVKRIIAALDAMSGEGRAGLKGIGIACTGRIDEAARSLEKNAFLSGWEGPGLALGLEEDFQVPVVIANDVVAAAAGAAASPMARGVSPLIFITVSTGIGGALVIDRHTYTGAGGSHTELGHPVLDPSGPLCYCGARGCWQSLASGMAMENWYAERVGMNTGRLSARQICEDAMQGSALAKEAVERTGRYLGIGIANLATLFLPEMLVLGGGLMKSYHLFEDRIVRTLREQCGMVPYERMQIVAAPEAEFTLSGAAELWKQRQGAA
jgi:glucokinase